MDRRKYALNIAENFLYVPAVLQTILSYEGFKVSQREIAKFFDLYVSREHKIVGLNQKETDDPNNYGIHLDKNSINSFFKENAFPLWEKHFSISLYNDFEFSDALDDLLMTDAHLVCGFSYGRLFNEEKNIRVGHVAIILDKKEMQVEILDPGPKSPGCKWVNIYDLYSSIRLKKDGIWVISKIRD